MKDQLSAFQKPRKHGERLLEKSVDLAEAARIHGNYQFGAVLRYPGTENLGGENSVNTSRDTTAHAEIEVIRFASPTLTKEQLSRSTQAQSRARCVREPSTPPASAEAFFAVGKNDVFPLVGVDTRNPMLQMGSRTVLQPARSR
jgi:hypothetical protein